MIKRFFTKLPKDIPTGAIVLFVIENIDKGGKWMNDWVSKSNAEWQAENKKLKEKIHETNK